MFKRVECWKNAISSVFDRLQDDESRTLFGLMFDRLVNGNRAEFVKGVMDLYNDWEMNRLDNIDEIRGKNVVICSCGENGLMSYFVLRKLGIKVECFTDKFKTGDVDGIPIMKISDIKKMPNTVYIISSIDYMDEIKKELCAIGVEKSVICPKHGCVSASRGNQYFDVFQPMFDGCFIDCGSYDGDSIIKYREWVKTKTKVIALEPILSNFELLKRRMPDDDIVAINAAAWDCDSDLFFEESGPGSLVSKQGVKVRGRRLDDIAGNEKIGFIKMDIEGSELKALIGARRIIERDHPKLAICLYHKTGDFLEIPLFILSIDSSYKFYIRHYTSREWETVLYAE